MSHHHPDLSLSGDEAHSPPQRDSAYDDAGSIHSESSMIFERNVEDPYSQVFSNPRLASLSRSASHANLTPFDSHDSLHESAGLSLSKSSSRKQSVAGNFVPHHALENLVAPALDEGVTIVNDNSTDLESVEMIYSRRPSTIGLDMALGRTRTNSSSDAQTLNGHNPRLMRTNSASQGSNVEPRPRVLRFYSYADMLSDENSSNPRRPSITQSLSSTLLRQQGAGSPTGATGASGADFLRAGGSPSNMQVGSPDFSNPFLNNQAAAAAAAAAAASGNGTCVSPLESHRKLSNVSVPPLAVATRHYSANLACRSPNTNTTNGHRLSTSPLMIPHNTNSALLRKSNFQIESSGSECSEDEDQDNNQHSSSNSSSHKNTLHRDLDHDVNSAGTLNTSPVNPQGLRLSRTSTQGSGFNKKFSPPAYKTRAYSNASGVSPYANNYSRNSFSSGNTQGLDDVLFDEQLHSNTVSEVLKKKLTNEI
ncbi:unnamed protein product [Kluyveromyces dobzhanskii CBS 2104]|uniref:WGS project CCBQ000000000 data, contig 00017 n=1 Tax=Kluyveromyces dobzhanskii CBS 2104 TaxID=1427455 RepID=A0A0A8L8F9_9SACH|nr:unnamed protein product [Kluyveromyces dobzhanskii CBS 2104]